MQQQMSAKIHCRAAGSAGGRARHCSQPRGECLAWPVALGSNEHNAFRMVPLSWACTLMLSARGRQGKRSYREYLQHFEGNRAIGPCNITGVSSQSKYSFLFDNAENFCESVLMTVQLFYYFYFSAAFAKLKHFVIPSFMQNRLQF